jgi:hypothetical protein
LRIGEVAGCGNLQDGEVAILETNVSGTYLTKNKSRGQTPAKPNHEGSFVQNGFLRAASAKIKSERSSCKNKLLQLASAKINR